MPSICPRRSPILRLMGLGVALAVMTGCGDGRIERHPVRGKVLVDGKPAAGATVIFCPVSGDKEFMKERPWATTGEDGSFELITFDPGDGAPVGDYKVMIRWAPKKGDYAERVEVDGRMVRSPVVDVLRGRYFNPERSGLEATITAGKNELPPFELEAPPRRGQR